MAYVCIFRTGGTENEEWKPAIPVQTLEEAVRQARELKRKGYPTIVERVKND